MQFKFIDLFAGIGGFRIAFEAAGAKCVFSSDNDKFAQLTYEAFFREKPVFGNIREVKNPGDITELPPEDVPDHDILVAGFPCQPFSLAGVSKKLSLGRSHGFDDPTQGTLFFNIKEILRAKKPDSFVFENVKNLLSHDNKKTFRIITKTLAELDYEISFEIIDASKWVPQHRERIFIVGIRRDLCAGVPGRSIPSEIFQKVSTGRKTAPKCLSEIIEGTVDPKYTLGPGTWRTLKRHKQYHAQKGQGFGYGILRPPFAGKNTRTLSARYHKDGAEILISQARGKRPRRLTPLECCRLMGFPKKYQKFYDWRNNRKEQPVSDTQAYRQFGNSVAVPVAKAVARAVCEKLKELKSGR